jgi:hypothetical protein
MTYRKALDVVVEAMTVSLPSTLVLDCHIANTNKSHSRDLLCFTSGILHLLRVHSPSRVWYFGVLDLAMSTFIVHIAQL